MKIGTFETTCSARFEPELLRKCINVHYLGQENCNKYDDKTGAYVQIKHPNMKNVEVAQNKLCPNINLTIKADLDENGRLSNFQVKN